MGGEITKPNPRRKTIRFWSMDFQSANDIQQFCINFVRIEMRDVNRALMMTGPDSKNRIV